MINKPIRMCIVCKSKIEQKNLIKLQCKDKKIIKSREIGRSFYICQDCIKLDEEKLIKYFIRFCKIDKNSMKTILKEFKENIFNG